MKISYAITVCNELNEITKLINFLLDKKRIDDEIVILFDKKNGIPEVWSLLSELKGEPNVSYHAASFKNHFADWKNHLTSLCSGDYIFQIDADEIPNEQLLINLPHILKDNSNCEVYLVSRVNTVKGMTQEHIKEWHWNVNEEGWVNWPDPQWRIYKNKPEIKWKNKVHEKLEGYDSWAFLPHEEEYALYHHKDIKRQEKQNKYYATL
tara:strand:- start:637 stop:1260 length:624 start_codon:yes stop_codon:yes gene_type:complete